MGANVTLIRNSDTEEHVMTYQPLISHRVAMHTWPGRSRAVGERLAQLVKTTRPLQGCLAIVACRDPQDLRLWHLSMCWNDEAAMTAWLTHSVAELFTGLVGQQLVMQIDVQPGASEAGLRCAG
jgi:quinol monooxygenase YgiN